MTIAVLLLAAIVLMITMLVLTLGVNELEKKGAELAEIIRNRYVLRQPARKPGATPPAPPVQGQGGINIPPPASRSPGRT
jgi:hypothetical protein